MEIGGQTWLDGLGPIGDRITLHNVRNCDYRSENEYTNCWSDRTYNLPDLRGADFLFVNWGVRWIGHPIVSFDFGNDPTPRVFNRGSL